MEWGSFFGKFRGGCIILEFHCIFMSESQKFSQFHWVSGEGGGPDTSAYGGLSPSVPPPTNLTYATQL